MTELVFRAPEPPEVALEIRVNFGVFAGRNATQAEIDDLARRLRGEVESFAIVAEERHEFGGDREASLRQVVIEVAPEYAGLDVDELSDRVLELANDWATACIHARADLGELGSEL
ncbi:MAG TPA: hypothetical protein VFL60_01330 [Gaiellaceae bacterium]|nr:hypothetical protein [Gaiellaceae bacterium]